MKLCFPEGVHSHTDSWGRTWVADSYGMVEVPHTEGLAIAEFTRAGFIAPRINTLYAEQVQYLKVSSGAGPFFILEKNIPIWRNNNNTGWVNALGAPVRFEFKPKKGTTK
mgnify:CR=1 FL=1